MGAALIAGRDAALGAVADVISAVAAGGSSVVVGSLSRIPIGALTDRLDARRMFPAVALLTVAPVLYLGHLARSMTGYLVSGFSSDRPASPSSSGSRS